MTAQPCPCFHPDVDLRYNAGLLAGKLNLTITTEVDTTNEVDTTDIVGNSSLVNFQSKKSLNASTDEISLEQRAERYRGITPLYNFEQLIVSEKLEQDLLLAIEALKVEPIVFDTWGLRKIEPFPHTALNFYGPPGTGKTLAAHGLAQRMNKSIVAISYAQIESKFVGESPKNIEAVFYAAEKDNAVLFIDEADSLLSKRLTNISSGSEQAINSLRSQLLISLEKFRGVVIFATNLIENYDKAFESRVYSIYFPLPDQQSRKRIWQGASHFCKNKYTYW